MQVVTTELPGVLLLEPKVFADDRGFFFESYNRRAFHKATGVDVEFVQDNHSSSKKNVLRGLHYQLRQTQGKLVRVISGEVWDVAVDLRRASPTFGRWAGFTLSAQSKRMAWIPPGFAHGFVVVSDTAEVLYKNDNVFADISGLILRDFDYAFEKYVAQRLKDMILYMGDPGSQLLFGSAWPLVRMGPYIQLLDGLGLSDEQKESVLWRTAAKLFRIEG